jgi:hypothetical protein
LNGFSATCSYEVTSTDGGTLRLPSALYLPLRELDEGTVFFRDGSERRVAIRFGAEAGSATFSFIRE